MLDFAGMLAANCTANCTGRALNNLVDPYSNACITFASSMCQFPVHFPCRSLLRHNPTLLAARGGAEIITFALQNERRWWKQQKRRGLAPALPEHQTLRMTM